jgi:hypothetical protein
MMKNGYNQRVFPLHLISLISSGFLKGIEMILIFKRDQKMTSQKKPLFMGFLGYLYYG